MSGHNRVSRVSAKAIGYLYFFDMYYFIWKALDFNKLTALLCHWGYVLERLCRAMTETAERAAIWRLSPLYWFPVGRFRHIGAIRAGSEKLQKMVKRIPSFFTQYRCRNSTFS